MNANEWSVPETEVVSSIGEALDEGRESVLATVVDVEGSAYRRPGAKMVIDPSGAGVGSITAGCLEDEVRKLARDVLDAGEPRVETYDLMSDDEDVWGLGVGCNGVIDVLLEPIDEGYRPVVDAVEAGADVGAIVVLDSEREGVARGDRAVFRPGAGFDESGDLDEDVAATVEAEVGELVDADKSDVVTVDVEGDRVTLFLDGIAAPPELLVLGSGHDVGPLVDLGRQNDFRVSVVGFRGAADLEERFPNANSVESTSPANLREAHDLDDETYAVVMTHNFIDDRLAVEELVEAEVPYIGLMGPRDRFEEMLDDFAEEGRTFEDEELDRIYTPVGLDLGGGSPYQIATSIVAEVMAVHGDRTPQHLTNREGPIHDRVDVESDADADAERETTPVSESRS